MKVLTAAQMREVDRKTVESGIPGLILMENAGSRVVECLQREFGPLESHHVVVLCGKGNNGGDGLVIARQLHTRLRPQRLDVVLAADPQIMTGDAAANLRMFLASGGTAAQGWLPEMHAATIVVDALLGTGLSGPAGGTPLEWIRRINSSFPRAKVVAVDIPSGMPSDLPHPVGETARADFTVTFTAPKVAHALPPNCDAMGRLSVAAIGSPPDLYEQEESIFLSLVEPRMFRHLLRARQRGGHKGDYGHALVVGGSEGKSGAAAMAGTAALRCGAGLVTVACTNPAHPALIPELMTEPLPAADALAVIAARKTVVAIGPGLGTAKSAAALTYRAYEGLEQPLVVDADALNLLASGPWPASRGIRVLTPHPGEMSRLTGLTTQAILDDRVAVARRFATERSAILVLKGQRSLIAFPDGPVWINPTGTPAMATGGSGDILTGMVAGLLAQFPAEPEAAVAAAVYLHGLAGELGADDVGELPLIATDLLKYLPRAIDACL